MKACELDKLNERVAITGANGFIGRALHSKLPGARVLNRKVHSLTDPDSLASFLEGVKVIFHLAGINAGSGYSPPSEDMTKNNVLATWNLIKAIRLYSKFKPLVVLLSSIHVYSKKEKHFIEESPLEASSYYGLTKLTQEIFIREAAASDVLDYVILRASNIYGSGCKPYYNSAVATFCDKLLCGEELELFGNGRSQLDLIYIDDVVEVLLKVYNLSRIDEPIFNLCAGRTVTIKHIVDILAQISGITPRVTLMDTLPIGFSVDNKKLSSVLGNIKFTDLRSGLGVTLKAAKSLRNQPK